MAFSDVFAWLAFLELLKVNQGGAAPAQPQAGPPGPPGPPGDGPAPSPVVPAVFSPPQPQPSPAPADVPSVAPTPSLPAVVPTVPVAPAVPPGSLPPMPAWPSVAPGTLPPFPGPGWTPDTPVTPEVAARAAYWNPQLWDYSSRSMRRPYVQEQFGGQWVTFAAAWHPGDKGAQTYMATEAWRLSTAPAVVPPIPVLPSTPGPSPTMGKPGPVGPEPGPGAWQTNAPYIGRYQAALAYLSLSMAQPQWDPGGVDSKYGAKTRAAVMSYQRDHGLTADGEAGNETAASLDALLGYRAAPAPGAPGAPAAAAPAPGPAPGPVAPGPMPIPTSAPLTPPAPVAPYPGPGAWQSNGAYIQRYQAALTYLAFVTGHPELDPQGTDGKYGPHTAAAVRAFQAGAGLSSDGQAGAATAAALDQAVQSHASASSAAAA